MLVLYVCFRESSCAGLLAIPEPLAALSAWEDSKLRGSSWKFFLQLIAFLVLGAGFCNLSSLKGWGFYQNPSRSLGVFSVVFACSVFWEACCASQLSLGITSHLPGKSRPISSGSCAQCTDTDLSEREVHLHVSL